jgi:hypothetical protein
MSKHSPGPWVVAVYGKYKRAIMSATLALPIAVIRADPLSKDVNDSNARLIAAAPDLLDALQHLMVAHGEQLDYAFQQAQDAISKATGDQS